MRATEELLAVLAFRRASREDVPAIVALYADDALSASREDVAFADPRPYLDAFEEIDADPKSALYVAELSRRVVATAQVTWLRHLTYRGGRVALVEAVHVARSERSRGIGEALIRHVIDEARRRGCRGVQLTSNKTRKDAHRFYERLGFAASHEGFKLPLS
jgi:GNAT superfamily N-acetyltransferase